MTRSSAITANIPIIPIVPKIITTRSDNTYVSIFKLISRQLTGSRPSAINASQFSQRDERWIFMRTHPFIPVAIRQRSIVDHRVWKSRDETSADDEFLNYRSQTALDQLGKNREREPTAFSVPQAKRNIFPSPRRRIIHLRLSSVFTAIEDSWGKIASKDAHCSILTDDVSAKTDADLASHGTSTSILANFSIKSSIL